MAGMARRAKAAKPPAGKPRGTVDPYLPDEAFGFPPQAEEARAASQFPLREVKVLAAADRTFRDHFPQWKQRIAEIVAPVSRCYEVRFHIRLKVIDCQPWQLKAEAKSFPDNWIQLFGIDPGNAEPVLGIAEAESPGEARLRIHVDEVERYNPADSRGHQTPPLSSSSPLRLSDWQ